MSDPSQSSNICKFCDSRFLSPLELECHLSFHLKELRKRFPEEYEKLIRRRTTGSQAMSAEFKRPHFISTRSSSDDSKLRKVNSETTVELLNLLMALNEKANEAKAKSNKVTVSLDFANPRFSIVNSSPSVTDDWGGKRSILSRTSSHIPTPPLQKKEFTFEKWEKKSQSAEFPRPSHSNHRSNVPSSLILNGTREKMPLPKPCCEWNCSHFSVPCKQNNLPKWCKPEFQIPGPHRTVVFNPASDPQRSATSSPSPLYEPRTPRTEPKFSPSQRTKDNRMEVDPDPADMANPENLALMAQAWLEGKSIDGMDDDDDSLHDSDSMIDLTLRL